MIATDAHGYAYRSVGLAGYGINASGGLVQNCFSTAQLNWGSAPLGPPYFGGIITNSFAVGSVGGNPNYFYDISHEPLNSFGLWVNTPSTSKYCTTNGNWCICNGSNYPWLAWENRAC